MTNPTTHRLVWLFDIDGTLLLTRGAGRDALVLGIRDRFGVHDPLDDFPFGGRTDPLILGDVARKLGLPISGATGARGAEAAELWEDVYAHMRRLMAPPRGGLLPGVVGVLDAVAAEPAWVSALLTGNMTEMARIKLTAFGIYDRFAFGAFGEEADDRDALACLAVTRAAERYGVPAGRCLVVGDTEHDIACARAAGARVAAVATGGVTRAALAACKPDLLLDDLTDSAPLLAWAEEIAREE